MKVLLLSTSWPRFPGDTAGAFVRGWALAFAARGHQITVLCPKAPETKIFEIDGPLKIHRVSYPGNSLFYGGGFLENVARKPWILWQIPLFLLAFFLKSLRLAKEIDLILAHWLLPSGLLAALVAQQTSIPFAAIAHSGDVFLLEKFPKTVQTWLSPLFSKGKIACVAPHLARKIALCSKQIEVIPMGVDPELFDVSHYLQENEKNQKKQINNQSVLSKKTFVVLAIGRLVPIKGFDLLINAMQGIENATLWLAGEGQEKIALQQQAKRVGISVKFWGHVSGKLRRDLFATADLLVLPSRVLQGRTEGLPVVVLEAFAAGLPVITSAAGGLVDWISDRENGFLVPPGDRNALHNTIQMLLQTKPLRITLAKNARRKAETLRWERIAASYEDFLQTEDFSLH